MDYLLEIGTEEIPSRLVRDLAEGISRGLHEALDRAGLPAATSHTYVTARRLAVHLEGLPASQPDRTERVLGPPAAVAFDEAGQPTQAAQGFARSRGVDPGDLERVSTDKGEYASLEIERRGRTAGEILAEAVPAVLEGLHLAVSMRWGRGAGPFVRPVRWIVSLLDDEVLPLKAFGVPAGRTTRGHRAGHLGPHPVPRASAYADILRAQWVEPDWNERLKAIEQGLGDRLQEGERTPTPLGGGELETGLAMATEHPVVVRGEISPELLDLPMEIVDTAMRVHQKMFAVLDADGGVRPAFLAVLNNEDPEGRITRNLRNVLEARLQDAAFFWERDRARPLAELAKDLSGVLFHERLGSYSDKLARMRSVAERLAGQWAFEGEDREALLGAIDLCKADLCTLTVGEFPELQGTVGGLLAGAQGYATAVAGAIRRHYSPFGLSPDEPAARFAHTVALLDQADTLVGCQGVGVQVSGSKDPFGLRRAAYITARVMAEGLTAPGTTMTALLTGVARSFEGVEGFEPMTAIESSLATLRSRFRYFLEEEGTLPYRYDEVNAVLAAEWERPREVLERLQAVHEVREAGELEGLAVPLKRIRNILREAKGRPQGDVVEALLREPAEKALQQETRSVRQAVDPLLDRGDYRHALERMAALRPVVDRFFEQVLVMEKDPGIRRNRLALLQQVRDLFLRVADMGEIVEAGPTTAVPEPSPEETGST